MAKNSGKQPPHPAGDMIKSHDNSKTGITTSVIADSAGKPQSYTQWNTFTGTVTKRGKFPM